MPGGKNTYIKKNNMWGYFFLQQALHNTPITVGFLVVLALVIGILEFFKSNTP